MVRITGKTTGRGKQVSVVPNPQAAQCIEAVLNKTAAADPSMIVKVGGRNIDLAWILNGQASAHEDLWLNERSSKLQDALLTRQKQTPDVDWIGLRNVTWSGAADATLIGARDHPAGAVEQHAYTNTHYATLCKFGSALRHARRRTPAANTVGYAAKVIVFGGSMTYGEGSKGCPTSKDVANSDCAWPTLLQHWFDKVYGAGIVEVVNLARRGATIAWLKANANQVVTGVPGEGKPTLFLVDFSVNDALGQGDYQSNTSKLVEAGRAAVAKLAPYGGVVLLQTYNGSCRTGLQQKKDRLAAGLGKCPTYSMPDGYQQISTGIPGFPLPLWHFNMLNPLSFAHPGWSYHTMLAETIGTVLAATDVCLPGATATGTGDGDTGKQGWCDKDGGSQSSLSSLNAIGAAAGLKLTLSKDGSANFVGGGSSDDCDKGNVVMVTAANGMQITPHSDDGPWEPLGYGVTTKTSHGRSSATKSEHSWRVSNVAAASHGTGTTFGGGKRGGWQLLELRQGKPGWISEESADRVNRANIAVDEQGRQRLPTLQFVPPKFKWMRRTMGAMRLYVEFMKTYENAGQAEVWYCGEMVAVLDALWTDRFSLVHGESVMLPPCTDFMHRSSWTDMEPDNPLGRVEFRRRLAGTVRAARKQAAGKADHDMTGTAKFKLISIALCTAV